MSRELRLACQNRLHQRVPLVDAVTWICLVRPEGEMLCALLEPARIYITSMPATTLHGYRRAPGSITTDSTIERVVGVAWTTSVTLQAMKAEGKRGQKPTVSYRLGSVGKGHHAAVVRTSRASQAVHFSLLSPGL